MGGAVGMCMRVAVSAVLVRMCVLVVVLMSLMLVVCCDDILVVFCAHFVTSVSAVGAFGYASILTKYVGFLKALQPYMGDIFGHKNLV